MKRTLIIIGPTGVGKTALATTLAKKFNGIILSADSVQVYKSLDIISGKDLSLLKESKFSLIDIASPMYSFNISDYLKHFRKDYESISSDLLPIVVGGSGFYIKALVDGVQTVGIKPNSKLREKLLGYTVSELARELKNLDQKRFNEMNNSDVNNRRRLIRAIEIAKAKITPKEKKGLFKDSSILIIGLFLPREILTAKIEKRVDERIREGALFEAEKIFASYKSLAPQIMRANGYKQLFSYLQGEYSFNEAIEKWKKAEIQNAKKQMTFFKKLKDVEWFRVDNKDFEEIVEAKISRWYNTQV